MRTEKYNLVYMVGGSIVAVVLLGVAGYIGVDKLAAGGSLGILEALLVGLTFVSILFSAYNGLVRFATNHLDESVLTLTVLLRQNGPGDTARRGQEDLRKEWNLLRKDMAAIRRVMRD